MRTQQVMFMGWLFATGTLVSLTFAGLWIGSSEMVVADAVSIFKQANILGIWSVTVPNVSFFMVGAKSMITMDFAFFQGSAAVFQWVLIMVIGYAFLFGLFTVAIGAIQGLFRR